jgi:4-amino-4-deoxy-L-arabinose transferase-like glycosyltransferase
LTKSRAILWGLFLLLAVRVAAMIWVPLTDPTEARYAEIARKMVETGNWITPQFDYGVPFWAKPPLHTWLSAMGIAAFGVNPFAVRLGILLSALPCWWRRVRRCSSSPWGSFRPTWRSPLA